jgi:choline-sulfatase
MIMAGPDVPVSSCETAVSLLDLSATIAAHFDAPIDAADGVTDLNSILQGTVDTDRIIFSEYHAAGAVSGAFMLRKGRWKLIHYVGYEDELFDLETDPEEMTNRADDPACATLLEDLHIELRKICDPERVDALAFEDQAELIERVGGRDAALKLGAAGATPPPAITK